MTEQKKEVSSKPPKNMNETDNDRSKQFIRVILFFFIAVVVWYAFDLASL